MKKNEKFDDFWYEEQFRFSLENMKLYHIRDDRCEKPFVVIGYNTQKMSFRRFKNKIRNLSRARIYLVSFFSIHKLIYQKNGPKFYPENSPFPDTIVDKGGRFTKDLIFENGYSVLTKLEGGSRKIEQKPEFHVITG